MGGYGGLVWQEGVVEAWGGKDKAMVTIALTISTGLCSKTRK